MQQQGGSQYGVPPMEMIPQFSSASAGPRQARMIGIHGNTEHLQHHTAAEAASPISSRSVPQTQVGVSSRSQASFFDELGGGGGGGGSGAVTRSFADEEVLGAGDEGERGGGVGSRWPRQETLALLKIRSEMDAAFRDATLKGPLWEDVSRKLAELGYKRSGKKCKEKFENVHKYYKRTKEGRAGRQDGKSYRFFSQLEALHSTTITPTVSSLSSAPKTANATAPTGSSMAVPPVDRVQPPPPQLSALEPDLPPAAAAAGISFSSDSSSSSSSDSDEDTDDGGAGDGGAGDGSRKRKREGWLCGSGKKMAFFEGLMKQLMERQEAMQQRFLETIEKREQDRMVREEAWKRQEMARLNREYELMAQERTMTANRDAAVISFLQKFTGGVNNPPNSLLEAAVLTAPAVHEPSPQEDQPESQRSQQCNEIVIHQPSVSSEPAAPAAEVAMEVVAGGCLDVACLSKSSPSSRWPKAEVIALIKLRSGLETRYLEAGPKGPLWEEISMGMKRLGYNRSTKRCKEKWENINKYFKKVKEGNKKRSEDAKTCPYFHELDALYRRKQQQEISAATNPAPLASVPTEQESNNGGHKNPVTIRSNIGNGGNHEGSGFQMPRSNANGLAQVFFGGAPNSGSDAALKKPEDIIKELMEQQNHEDDDDDDDEVDDDDYDDDDDEEDGKMRYEIQFQRQSVGAAGGSRGGNAAGKAPVPTPPSSNAGSFLAMVQ